MATLLLRLAAPLQSWGMDSKFETRKTNREPTKSGVVGLLAAALGIRRDEPDRLAPLNRLRLGVRVDQEGSFLIDYQTVRKEGKTKSDSTSYITWRHYLSDAIFLVGLESEDIDFLAPAGGGAARPCISAVSRETRLPAHAAPVFGDPGMTGWKRRWKRNPLWFRIGESAMLPPSALCWRQNPSPALR